MPTSPAPNSMVEYAEWLIAMHKWPHNISIRDYHNPQDNDASREAIIEATRHISTGMRGKVLSYVQEKEDDETVNHYFFSDDAKLFWTNGLEEGKTPADILSGWEAMQSMLADLKSDDAEK